MLIGETSTFEKTTDRAYHTGDGSKTQFGIQFSGDNVQIFKEGILQRNGTDITIDPGGMHITFGTAPASGDKIDCLGFLEITNTGRNSVKRIEHLASAGQTQFTIPNFEVLDTLFVTLNGVVLYSTDFTQDITQGWIVLASPAVQDDVVTIMHFKPTFRIGSSGSSAAAASAVLAETSATNAAASLDSFDDRYLGAKSSVPTLDNDGDALLDGTLYFDTTGNNMRVYDLGATTWSVLDTLPQGLAATDSPEFLAVKTADIKSKTGVASLAITDAGKIKLPVASGIYKGASDTAVLTESSGVVTLDNVTLGSSVTGLKLSRNEGLVVKYVGATTVDIDADLLTVFDSSNGGTVLSSINLTADITASGVNGLDTGVEAAVWYHIYVIYNGTTVASLLSASATAPTMPSGYTYKKYVGAVYNPSSSFQVFHQIGNDVVLGAVTSDHRVVVNGTATSYTSVALGTAVPITATAVFGNHAVIETGTRALSYVAATSSGLGESFNEIQGPSNIAGSLGFYLPLVETQTIYYYKHSTLGVDADVYISGYNFSGIV